MLRFYMPLVFFVAFVGWVLYRLLVKKDLKQNLNNLYAGFSFIGIWLVIYYFVIK